jgi:hypothetical protein
MSKLEIIRNKHDGLYQCDENGKCKQILCHHRIPHVKSATCYSECHAFTNSDEVTFYCRPIRDRM